MPPSRLRRRFTADTSTWPIDHRQLSIHPRGPALSFLLLLFAFRSLLIPLQAAVTNLLCVGAAFGVLTATFQWGWGLSRSACRAPMAPCPSRAMCR